MKVRIVLLAVLMVLGSVTIVYAQAQDETITMTTYYPAPYGEYAELATNELRLVPIAAPAGPIVPGLIYYDSDDNNMYYYNGSQWIVLGGSGHWIQSGNNLYSENTNSNVGIGTTSPDSKLHLSGTGVSSGITLGDAGDVNIYRVVDPWGNLYLQSNNRLQAYRIRSMDWGTKDDVAVQIGDINTGFFSPASNQIGMSCEGTHKVTVSTAGLFVNGRGWCSSDMKFKKDIITMPSPIVKLMKLRAVEFSWNRDEFLDKSFSEGRQIGIVAQEMEEVFPQLVTADSNGDKYVDYASLGPILLEAIKDQQRQILLLEKRVKELEASSK